MDVEKYLSSFFRGTKNPSLKAMEYFMDEFDHPEKDLKIIHIAGTNGKGSCAEMATNVLIKSGLKVGKFISPHLIKYNERISVQNKDISDKEMEDLINEIKPKIEAYNKENDVDITLFELETTMALLYFYRNKCDVVVMEVGLGGTYDCTNIVHPLVSIISSIGYDHMHILGNTLLEIAENKAGIIKENSDTIFVMQKENEVNKKIIDTCKEKNNDIHLISNEDISNFKYNKEFQTFDYKEYKKIKIPLKGEKQLYNASIVIECMEILNKKGFNITEENIKDGFETVIHRARFEKISDKPLIIYDGGHNKPAIENFINTVKMYYEDLPKKYIISLLNTKDYKTVIKELSIDKESEFIFTDGNDKERYTSKEQLYDEAKKYLPEDKLYMKDLKVALKEIEKSKKQVTFVVGSFYIYGDVIKEIRKR